MNVNSKQIISYLLLSMLLSFFGKAQVPPGSGNDISLNGVNQYVALNSSFGTLSFPVTLTIWYNPGNNQQGFTRFFSSHDCTGVYRGFLWQYLNGDINLQCGNGTSRTGTGRWGFVAPYAFTPGRWYHVAVVMPNDNSAQIYVNGVPINTTAGSGAGTHNLVTDNSSGRIGANTAGNNITFLHGELDEFTFWNKALTQAEIRDMMCRKLTGNEPNLLSYYRFDDGTGTTVSNLVAGAPSGTLMNGATWATSSAPVGDRSVHNGYSPGASAIGLSNQNDTIEIDPTVGGLAGTQLYMIDVPPASVSGINVHPSVSSYFGVFNADYGRSYDVEVKPGPALSTVQQGKLELAHRPHNASPTWTPTNDRNVPTIVSTGYTVAKQFMVVAANCPNPNWLPTDTSLCGPVSLSIPGSLTNVSWSTGSSSNSITVNNTAQVWVEATDPSTGCVLSDTCQVTIGSPSNVNSLSLDTSICSAGSVTMNLTTNNAVAYEWFDGATNTTRTFSQPGSYWFFREFANGCIVYDTLNIQLAGPMSAQLVQDSVFMCGGDTALLQVNNSGYVSVSWSNGSTSWQTEYFSLGRHWVEVQNAQGCSFIDTFYLAPSGLSTLPNVFGDMSICSDEITTLSAPIGYSVIWPDGTTGDYSVSGSGPVFITVSDGCNSANQSFNVTEYTCNCSVYIPNSFTPNGDGLNDYFKPLSECEFLEYKLIVINRFGQIVFTSYNSDEGFDGTYNGKELPIGAYSYLLQYRTYDANEAVSGVVNVIR